MVWADAGWADAGCAWADTAIGFLSLAERYSGISRAAGDYCLAKN
jgi:hypothetical protein